MTQENKELLLQDLCTRLPYGVIISWCNEEVEHKRFILKSITSKEYKSYIRNGEQLAINGKYIEWKLNNVYDLGEFIKPYLRPMSSMTKEEKEEYTSYCFEQPFLQKDKTPNLGSVPMCIDYCLAHHFDFRGLIPMGLALEAPEGMYK